MSNLISVEVHYDRAALSLLVTSDEATAIEMAVRDGESVSVQSRNWINKELVPGVYVVNGKRVNYIIVKPDTDLPF